MESLLNSNNTSQYYCFYIFWWEKKRDVFVTLNITVHIYNLQFLKAH